MTDDTLLLVQQTSATLPALLDTRAGREARFPDLLAAASRIPAVNPFVGYVGVAHTSKQVPGTTSSYYCATFYDVATLEATPDTTVVSAATPLTMRFTPDGTKLLWGYSGVTKLFDAATRAVLQAQTSGYSYPLLTNDRLISVGSDGYNTSLRLADWGVDAFTAPASGGYYDTLAGPSCSGDYFALPITWRSSAANPMLRVFRSSDLTEVTLAGGQPTGPTNGGATATAFSGDGKILAVYHATNTVTLYDTTTWEKLRSFTVPTLTVGGTFIYGYPNMALDYYGTRLAARLSAAPYVAVFDTRSGAQLTVPSLSTVNGTPSILAFTPFTPLRLSNVSAMPITDDTGAPAQRQIFAHNRASGVLIGATTSDASGRYAMSCIGPGPAYVVFLDDAAGTQHNDIVVDRVRAL